MRVKKEYRTVDREQYDRFLKENKLTEKDLSFEKFVKNIQICNWMFIEYILRTGKRVFLPYGFGPLTINKKMLNRYKVHEGVKYINLRVDWKKTRELGKRIYHTNEHTDGYNYKWMWEPKNARFHLSDISVFKPCRYASRALTKYLKKPNSIYKDLYLEWLHPKIKK